MKSATSLTIPILMLKHVNHSVKRCLISLRIQQNVDQSYISVRRLSREFAVSQNTAMETLRILKNPNQMNNQYWEQQSTENNNSNSHISAMNTESACRLANLDAYFQELFDQSSSIFKKINSGATSPKDRDACILTFATLLLHSNRLGEVTNLRFSDLEKILVKSKDSVRRYLRQLREMKLVKVLFTGNNSKDFAQSFNSVYQLNLNLLAPPDCEYSQQLFCLDKNVFEPSLSMYRRFRFQNPGISNNLLKFMGNMFKSDEKPDYFRFLHSFVNICVFETLNLQNGDIAPSWPVDYFEYFLPDSLYGKDKVGFTPKELNDKIGQIPVPVKKSLELLYQNYNLVLEESQSIHELSILLLHLAGVMIAELNHILLSDFNIKTKKVQNPEMLSLYIRNERIFADQKTIIWLRIHNNLLAPEDSSVS